MKLLFGLFMRVNGYLLLKTVFCELKVVPCPAHYFERSNEVLYFVFPQEISTLAELEVSILLNEGAMAPTQTKTLFQIN